MCIAWAGIENFWTNTLRHNLLLLEKHRIDQDKEWEKVRYLAWSSGNFGKGKKPDSLFPLRIDSMFKKKHKKEDDKALAAFEKYKSIYEGKDKKQLD